MKKIKLFIFTLFFFVFSVITVNAATNMTDILPAPGLTPGSTVNTEVYILTTNNSSQSVTGSNTSVIFS